MAHGDQACNAQTYPAESRTKVAVGKRLLMVAIRTFRDNRTKAIETIILCAGLDSQFARLSPKLTSEEAKFVNGEHFPAIFERGFVSSDAKAVAERDIPAKVCG